MARRTLFLTYLIACNWWGAACAHGSKPDGVGSKPGVRANVEEIGSAAKLASKVESSPVQAHESDSLALRELLAEPTEYVDVRDEGRRSPARPATVKILGLNDFHGSLSAGGHLQGRPLGGAAVLGSYLAAHSRGFEGRVVIAQAGDFVGASPAVSALFHDQPSIEFFNHLSNGNCMRGRDNPDCNLLGALGNHEFDHGTTDLLRLVQGGAPAWSADGRLYQGECYPTLCANVLTRTGRPLFPPYVIRNLGPVKVGFIGAVLSGASWFLKKSGIVGLTFEDETESINRAATALKRAGIHAIVLMIHQGGKQRFSRALPRDASSVQGEVKDIVSRLDGDIDVVISGHSHSALSALVPNREGGLTLLTQAFHSGTAFSEIELDVDPSSGEVVRKRAVILSTFADVEPGSTPDPQIERLVQNAERLAERTTRARLSSAPGPIPSDVDRNGESPMGDLVADAQRTALHADIAFTTPSWVRADLNAGEVTWGDIFTVQPFNNRLMRVEMFGRDVIELLNQQWYVETYPRALQVSGLGFSWDARKPKEARVSEVQVDGKPIEPNRRYIAAVNEFLAEGGEGYSKLESLPRSATSITDIQALVEYVKARPVLLPPPGNRVKRLDPQ